MKEDHPSVEELLKSLRKTLIQKSDEKENREEVLDLGVPIKKSRNDSAIIDFVEEILVREVRSLIEAYKDEILKSVIEKQIVSFSLSDDLMAEVKRAALEYVDSRSGEFHGILKDVIEQRIAQLIKIS